MRFVAFVLPVTLAIAGQYTTYIGDAYPRSVTAIATDAAGNTYVTGNRSTGGVPTAIFRVGTDGLSSPLPTTSAPPNDVFVSKIDPSGKVLLTDTFAGKGVDLGLAVAVDPIGNIYVAGTTTSVDFPITNALQSQPSQYGAGFIVKLSPDGKTILYSTYFGGVAGLTTINAMTTDAGGDLYLTGSTSATDFPGTSGTPSGSTGQEPGQVAFVAAISPAGDKILFSKTVGSFDFVSCIATVFGCSEATSGVAIALDGSRNTYFGGNTLGDIATTPGALVARGLGAFVGKIGANGAGLAYLTYLSSDSELGPGYNIGPTQLSSLTVDNAGNAYLGGTTGDPKFPVTAGAYQTTFAGNPVDQFGIPANTDGFLAKLNPSGSAFVWATYLGGSGNDSVNSIAVDLLGDVWAVGATASSNFPNAYGWSSGDDFLVAINPTGSALGYSARYPNGSISQAVALQPSLVLHTAGPTGILAQLTATIAAPPPTLTAIAPPPYFGVYGIGNAAGGSIAGRISPGEVISIYGPTIRTGGGDVIASARSLATDPTSLEGVQVTIGGILAPLLYVSSNQINAVVPMEVTPQAASTVQVESGPTFPVWIDASDAILFPGVLNQDGTLNSETNPAKAASIVSFYATGWQSSFAPLADGQIATQANNACPATNCSASQGAIVYAGAAPGIVAGVTQFNLQLNGGAQPVAVKSLQQVAISVVGIGQLLSLWVTP